MKTPVLLLLLFICVNMAQGQPAIQDTQSPPPRKVKKYNLKDTDDMNSWNLGVNLGLTYPHTDISASSKRNFAYGLDVTKFLTHTTALQARFMRGMLSGTDVNRPLYQFETDIDYDISLNALFQFGNIAFLKHNPNLAFYASIGVGLVHFSPDVYTDGGLVAKRGLYSQYAQPLVEQDYQSTSNLVVPVGVGIKYRLGETISVNGEYSFRKTNSDKLDGFYKLLSSDDNYSYFNVGLTYHLGNRSRVIEWVNPMQALYNEMNEMNSKIELFRRDTDADGVPDYFDREPDTPPGTKVYGDGTSVILDRRGTFNNNEISNPPIKPAEPETKNIIKQEEIKNDSVIQQIQSPPVSIIKSDTIGTAPALNHTPAVTMDTVPKQNPEIVPEKIIEPKVTYKPLDAAGRVDSIMKAGKARRDSVKAANEKHEQSFQNTDNKNHLASSSSNVIPENVIRETTSTNAPSKSFINRMGVINPDDTTLLQNYEDLPSLYFGIADNKIASRHYKTIEYIALVMQNNPKINYTILGVCDGSGNESFNYVLGLRRAESVKQYLINNYKIDPVRLTTKTLGAIDINRGPNPLNRRVDINVSK